MIINFFDSDQDYGTYDITHQAITNKAELLQRLEINLEKYQSEHTYDEKNIEDFLKQLWSKNFNIKIIKTEKSLWF